MDTNEFQYHGKSLIAVFGIFGHSEFESAFEYFEACINQDDKKTGYNNQKSDRFMKFRDSRKKPKKLQNFWKGTISLDGDSPTKHTEKILNFIRKKPCFFAIKKSESVKNNLETYKKTACRRFEPDAHRPRN